MSPTRRTALGLIGAGLASPALPRTRLAYDLVPRPVADGIWMVEGAREYFSAENGGAIVNIVLLESAAGLIIVDTGPSLRYGEALRAVAEGLSGTGIAAVILTHHHPDHCFGNQALAELPIYALPETGRWAAFHGDAYADNMYRLLGDWMRGTEPVPPNTSMPVGEITIGGRTLTALPLGGHSEADLALLDQRTGTLIAGDLAFLDRAPTTPDADLAQWQDSLAELGRLEAAAIIPGHGPLDRTGASLRQTGAYLDWLNMTLRDSAANGLDMIEVMELPLPERFAALGAQPQEFQRSVTHLFPEIETAILPLLD